MSDEEKLVIIGEIGRLVEQLGWSVLIPDTDTSSVAGIIIGNDEFLNEYVLSTGDLDAEIVDVDDKSTLH